MWALLAAIAAVSIALAFVSAARRRLLAKDETTAHACPPCCHACQRKDAR